MIPNAPLRMAVLVFHRSLLALQVGRGPKGGQTEIAVASDYKTFTQRLRDVDGRNEENVVFAEDATLYWLQISGTMFGRI